MWKKHDDATAKPLKFGSEPMSESSSEELPELIGVHLDSQVEKWKSTVSPQRVPPEDNQQPSMPAATATYIEAVNEFTKNATAFIQWLPLLAKARESYEQAMKASAKLRTVLDTRDEDVRVLMTQLMKVVEGQAVKPVPEKKKPEPAKAEADSGKESLGTHFPKLANQS
jgi:hypothetical protein